MKHVAANKVPQLPQLVAKWMHCMWRAEGSKPCLGRKPQERSRDYTRVEDAKVMMLGRSWVKLTPEAF